MRHTIAVDCDQCGKTHGKKDINGYLRCGECGQYAEKAEDYCAEHDVDYSNLTDYDNCPYCMERESAHQQYVDKITRDRRIEPW